MACDRRRPEDPRAGERKGGKADDREADERRHGGPVGDERAREELPLAPVGNALRRRREIAERDSAEAGQDGDDRHGGSHRGHRNDGRAAGAMRTQREARNPTRDARGGWLNYRERWPSGPKSWHTMRR